MKNKKLKALTSVEIILSLSLFFILVLGLSGAIFYGLNTKREVSEETKASFILDQAIEALSSIKDASFSNIIAGNWGIVESSGQWALSPNFDQQDGFVRQIVISDINENEKQAVININWASGTGRNRLISSTIRMTNWEREIVVIYPVDWSNPIYAGDLDILNTNGGFRVKLGSDKAYLFKQPDQEDFNIIDTTDIENPASLSVMKLDGVNLPYDLLLDGNYVYLTSEAQMREFQILDVSNPRSPILRKYLDLEGNADATGIAKQNNYIYITRLNNGALSEFYIINVTNILSPTVTGKLNLSTNSAFDVAVSGNYAYLATGANNAELTIVNISNPAAPSFVSGLDLPTDTDGTRLVYYNGIVYLVQGSNLRIINVTNPSSPVLLATYAAGGAVGDLVTAYPLHPYLFLATSNSAMELQILDVTNPVSPLLFGQFNTNSALVGVDYDPVREIVGAVGNDTANEFIIISGRLLN